MSDIAKLTVALYANSAQFVSELQKSQRKSNEWKREVSAAYNTVKTAGAVAAAATVASLTLIYKQQSKLIDQTAKFADRIGISTESLSQFRYAAELTGVGQKSLDNSLQAMVRRLAEAEQGTGEAAKSLRQLGLDAEELGRLTPDEQLYVLADAFKGVESQSERVRIAFNLFGREGVSMVNMLAGGADGLRAMAKEADDLGLSLSRVDAAKVEIANDAFLRATKASTAFEQQITTQLAPVIAGLSDEFVRMAKEHGGMSKVVTDGIYSTAKGVSYVGDAYRGWTFILKSVEVAWLQLKLVGMEAMNAMVRAAYDFGTYIVQYMVWPTLKALDAMGLVNDSAKEMADSLRELTTISGPPIFNLEDTYQTRSELKRSVDEFRALLSEPLPSDNIENWYQENKARVEALAQDMASSVNRNSASAGALTPEGKPAKEGPTEQEKALERHRLEMDRIRQGFLEKDQLEYEQWQERQSKLADWFLAEYEASKSNKAQMAALEGQYLTLSQNNHKKYQDNINKIESARMQTRYKAASSMFGSMADLAKTFGGEQTGAYKALFAVSKAFSIAESIMAIQTGVAKAAALGWPAGIPAMASVLSATSGIISTIQGTAMPTYHTGGMAGYGSDNFSDSLKRNEVPAILERDEEILPTYDPRHRSNLRKSRGAGGGFVWTGNIIMNNNGEPVRAEASMDDEGNLQMWLERADEFIAQGFIEGTGQTSQANDAVNGSGRANTAIR
ncbi:hypothetical protein [Neptunomonas japonica]|uniref:hypothetical protein n=1 Tax=Neptunomonas japonica TaxID=417574 RepID=UPI0003F96AE2|nr:hypothetical protein [Neptunomonas japonica]